MEIRLKILKTVDSFNDFSIHVGSGTLRTYGNWHLKLEITKSREAERSKKNRERRRNDKEEEAKAGGETTVDQMEVAGDMEVTGDVVVSGCDDKN